MAEKKEKVLRDRVGRPAKAPEHPLYRLFEERGIDKKAFSQAVGINRLYLDQILRGDHRPGSTLALKMSKLLGIPLEDILFPKVREAKEEKRQPADSRA